MTSAIYFHIIWVGSEREDEDVEITADMAKCTPLVNRSE